MSDEQIVAIIAAIVGHRDLQPGGREGAKEENVRLHVETARDILAEATKHTRGFGQA